MDHYFYGRQAIAMGDLWQQNTWCMWSSINECYWMMFLLVNAVEGGRRECSYPAQPLLSLLFWCFPHACMNCWRHLIQWNLVLVWVHDWNVKFWLFDWNLLNFQTLIFEASYLCVPGISLVNICDETWIRWIGKLLFW